MLMNSLSNFRIVLPWRTFFMEAPTVQNKKEWMEILRWKKVSYRSVDYKIIPHTSGRTEAKKTKVKLNY